MFGTGRETLPDVQEALSDVREWTRGSLGSSGVVERPSRMIGSGRETLANVQVWWKALTDVRE